MTTYSKRPSRKARDAAPERKKEIPADCRLHDCAGSVKPAEWIATRKGDKEATPLVLTPSAAAFLAEPLLVKVDRVGQPPVKQVVPGPRTSNVGKAAR